MIATQFFYTLCYCGLLIALLFLLMYLFCINDYYRVSVLRWIGIDLIMSGKHLRMHDRCNVAKSNKEDTGKLLFHPVRQRPLEPSMFFSAAENFSMFISYLKFLGTPKMVKTSKSLSSTPYKLFNSRLFCS